MRGCPSLLSPPWENYGLGLHCSLGRDRSSRYPSPSRLIAARALLHPLIALPLRAPVVLFPLLWRLGLLRLSRPALGSLSTFGTSTCKRLSTSVRFNRGCVRWWRVSTGPALVQARARVGVLFFIVGVKKSGSVISSPCYGTYRSLSASRASPRPTVFYSVARKRSTISGSIGSVASV